MERIGGAVAGSEFVHPFVGAGAFEGADFGSAGELLLAQDEGPAVAGVAGIEDASDGGAGGGGIGRGRGGEEGGNLQAGEAERTHEAEGEAPAEIAVEEGDLDRVSRDFEGHADAVAEVAAEPGLAEGLLEQSAAEGQGDAGFAAEQAVEGGGVEGRAVGPVGEVAGYSAQVHAFAVETVDVDGAPEGGLDRAGGGGLGGPVVADPELERVAAVVAGGEFGESGTVVEKTRRRAVVGVQEFPDGPRAGGKAGEENAVAETQGQGPAGREVESLDAPYGAVGEGGGHPLEVGEPEEEEFLA